MGRGGLNEVWNHFHMNHQCIMFLQIYYAVCFCDQIVFTSLAHCRGDTDLMLANHMYQNGRLVFWVNATATLILCSDICILIWLDRVGFLHQEGQIFNRVIFYWDSSIPLQFKASSLLPTLFGFCICTSFQFI